MKRAIAIVRSDYQAARIGAFAEGLRRHGWKCEISADPSSACDLLVLWSVRRQDVIARQKADGGEVCILECGYLGDRVNKWSSVSLGGRLNGRARFPVIDDGGKRFGEHFGHLMQPWSRRDGYVLIIGQVAGDMSLAMAGGDLGRWYGEAASAVGGDVRFRPHPKGSTPAPAGLPVIDGTLENALSGARVVVTFNSNTGVEAVLAGVPTITTDEGSMAWPVAAHGFDEPLVTPDRSEWAARLAFCQWTMEEMRSGDTWATMKENEKLGQE